MNFQKRSSGQPETSTPQEQPQGKKPVVIYIALLFMAAFLLMALSLFMHQRSNAEALGQLQSSLSDMQEVQAAQDQIISLQQQLSQLDDQLDLQETALEDAEEKTRQAQQAAQALLSLYTLQQQYAAQDYEACLRTMQEMEDQSLVELLPQETVDGVTPPSQRYQQLKEAVLNH